MASKAGKGESPGAFPWDLESTRQRPEKITVSIGKTLSDIHHSRILYDPPPRVTEIKTKINKCDLIKIKSFCTMNKTVQGEKTAFRMGENNSK